MRHTSKHICPK